MGPNFNTYRKYKMQRCGEISLLMIGIQFPRPRHQIQVYSWLKRVKIVIKSRKPPGQPSVLCPKWSLPFLLPH